jgi:hypothetical protein
MNVSIKSVTTVKDINIGGMMNNYKSYVCLIVGIFLISMTAYPISAIELQNVSSLRGIDSIYVKVSDPDPEMQKELKKGGLNFSLLNYVIEQKLENVGIHVLSDDEYRTSQQKNMLYLNLQILPQELMQKHIYTVDGVKVPKSGPENKYLYMIRLEFHQSLSLSQNADIKVLAVTWGMDTFGLRRLKRIQEEVNGLADAFVNDFKIANPKAIGTK